MNTPTASTSSTLNETERFVVVKVVESAPFEVGQLKGSVELIIQRRRKDDGKLSREFISCRLTIGGRTIFIRPELVESLYNGLGLVKSCIEPEQKRLDDENEKRRSSRQVPHYDSRKQGPPGLSNFIKSDGPGKTEKKKMKMHVNRQQPSEKK